MLLYLDVDGVLNSNYSMLNAYGKIGYKGYQELISNTTLDYSIISIYEHILSLSNLHCQYLCKFIKKYNIDKIVICSTWRLIFDVNQLKLLFLAKGYPEIANLITDITPSKITISTSKDNVKSIIQTRPMDESNYNTSFVRIWIEITDDIKNKFLKSVKDINTLSLREAEIIYHYVDNKHKDEFIILDDDVKHLKNNHTSKFLHMFKNKK